MCSASVLFDAIFVPGGRHVEVLRTQGDAVHFINEAFKHGKPIAASGEGVNLLRAANLANVQFADSGEVVESLGVVTVAGPEAVADRLKGVVGMAEGTGPGAFTARFLEALAQHRHWGRNQSDMLPA